MRGTRLTALVFWLSLIVTGLLPGCGGDDIGLESPRLSLRLIWLDSPHKAQLIDRVQAVVFDSSDVLVVGDIPASDPYQAVLADFLLPGAPAPFVTWELWRALVGGHYDVVDEATLPIVGEYAEGTLRAAPGWNLVLVGLMAAEEMVAVGLGPAFGERGGDKTTTIFVGSPLGYDLPGFGNLFIDITSPPDQSVVQTPSILVEGFTNDPFLTEGSFSVSFPDDFVTPEVLPLDLGFFAVEAQLIEGLNLINASVRRSPFSPEVFDAIAVTWRPTPSPLPGNDRE